LEVDDVVARGGDGVTEEEDALGSQKRARFLGGSALWIYFFLR
jgi:hypothetical protein